MRFGNLVWSARYDNVSLDVSKRTDPYDGTIGTESFVSLRAYLVDAGRDNEHADQLVHIQLTAQQAREVAKKLTVWATIAEIEPDSTPGSL